MPNQRREQAMQRMSQLASQQRSEDDYFRWKAERERKQMMEEMRQQEREAKRANAGKIWGMTATGAMIGSMIAPGVGTAVGAGVGRFVGGLSEMQYRRENNLSSGLGDAFKDTFFRAPTSDELMSIGSAAMQAAPQYAQQQRMDRLYGKIASQQQGNVNSAYIPSSQGLTGGQQLQIEGMENSFTPSSGSVQNLSLFGSSSLDMDNQAAVDRYQRELVKNSKPEFMPYDPYERY